VSEVAVRTLEIEGMSCASCVARVERSLRGVAGVESVSVNLATEHAEVVAAPAVPEAALEDAVRRAGYAVRRPPAATDEVAAGGDAAEGRRSRRRAGLRRHAAQLGVGAVLSAAILVLAYGFSTAPWSNPVQLVLALPVFLWVGARFHAAALRGLRHGAATMDTLVSAGATVAFGYSVAATLAPPLRGQPTYFDTAALILTLISLGRLLEAMARGRAGAAIEALAGLQPRVAHRLEEGDPGRARDVLVDRLAVGDLVMVRPGEPIPTDGTLAEGAASVDESLVTGESLPVLRHAGDELVGGSVNGLSPLVMRVTRTGRDTVLAHIVRLVERAQAEKAPVQRLADRISSVFVPAILLLAAATFAGWLVAGRGPVGAMIPAVATLVIACPCALGLATPIAVMVAGGRGAQMGLLIRGGDTLEEVQRLRVVVLDKTGTLSAGRPEVTDAVAVGEGGGIEDVARGGEGAEALVLAGAVEARSEHPLAGALVARASAETDRLPVATEVVSEPGGGVSGSVGGRPVLVGAPGWVAARGVPVPPSASAEVARLAALGRTVVAVAVEGRLRLILGIADPLRPESAAGVSRLRAMGLRVVLASGDTLAAVAAVARQVGIEEWHGELRPEGKAALIAELQRGGGGVAMVGDGINDAPALAAADVGVALGTGTGAAMAAADITLVQGGVGRVADALALSRATLRTVRQNLAWALGYNAVLVPLAMVSVIPPVLAALAMALSSVSVVGNSLRLRRWGRSAPPSVPAAALAIHHRPQDRAA
jgi:Cu+-exporting ATPase